ncbi:MAG: alpha-amylase family glycosyl hydrolase, partial [Bacillota bacterium]
MKNLETILKCLENNCHSFQGSYFIPEIWNAVKFNNYSKDPARKGQISLNPYFFAIAIIRDYILANGSSGKDYLTTIGLQKGTAASGISQSIIYGMLPRVFTAWDHYRPGEICPGTFLKAICLLPYLKDLKVDLIYLLPVFERSQKYKKGEIGSPYAIKNLYRIDPELHDNLLGDDAGEMVETEFKAFIEACHLLRIKVMLDFTFRTVSRDNDLLREHPDWFYWIKLDKDRAFAPPTVETEPQLSLLNNRSLKNLYTCQGIREFLGRFSRSPKELDPVKWRRLLEECFETGANLLDLIEQHYQITTAPGFSNVLNDPQPPWTDVTYLRYYFDVHKKARSY